MGRRSTPLPRIKKQPADPKLRTLDEWRCDAGHDFGVDPERAGGHAPRCPVVLGQASNGRWVGCDAPVEFVRKGGPLRDREAER